MIFWIAHKRHKKVNWQHSENALGNIYIYKINIFKNQSPMLQISDRNLEDTLQLSKCRENSPLVVGFINRQFSFSKWNICKIQTQILHYKLKMFKMLKSPLNLIESYFPRFLILVFFPSPSLSLSLFPSFPSFSFILSLSLKPFPLSCHYQTM